MPAFRTVRAARPGRAVAAAALVLASLAACPAADAPQRGGGLVPAPRKTREELVREWDLNKDGKIDQGEAEVAAARMRRERAELRLNSGIDPVTGRPRDEAGDDEEAMVEEQPDEAVPEEEPVEEAKPDENARPGPPGARVPRPPLPGAGAGRARGAGTAGSGVTSAADPTRQPMTGGIRGGGIPARPGYGSGVPSGPLNAGLPIVPRMRPLPGQGPRVGPLPGGQPAAPMQRPSAPPPRMAPTREPYNPY